MSTYSLPHRRDQVNTSWPLEAPEGGHYAIAGEIDAKGRIVGQVFNLSFYPVPC